MDCRIGGKFAAWKAAFPVRGFAQGLTGTAAILVALGKVK